MRIYKCDNIWSMNYFEHCGERECILYMVFNSNLKIMYRSGEP